MNILPTSVVSEERKTDGDLAVAIPSPLAKRIVNRVLLVVAAEALATVGVVYHCAATLVLAFPAAAHLISKKIPESYSWNAVRENHINRIRGCFQIAYRTPFEPRKSETLKVQVKAIATHIFTREVPSPAQPDPTPVPEPVSQPLPWWTKTWTFLKEDHPILTIGAACLIAYGLYRSFSRKEEDSPGITEEEWEKGQQQFKPNQTLIEGDVKEQLEKGWLEQEKRQKALLKEATRICLTANGIYVKDDDLSLKTLRSQAVVSVETSKGKSSQFKCKIFETENFYKLNALDRPTPKEGRPYLRPTTLDKLGKCPDGILKDIGPVDVVNLCKSLNEPGEGLPLSGALFFRELTNETTCPKIMREYNQIIPKVLHPDKAKDKFNWSEDSSACVDTIKGIIDVMKQWNGCSPKGKKTALLKVADQELKVGPGEFPQYMTWLADVVNAFSVKKPCESGDSYFTQYSWDGRSNKMPTISEGCAPLPAGIPQ